MLKSAPQFLCLEGLLDNGLKFRPMTLPDTWIEHGDYSDQIALAGLTASQIATQALVTMGKLEAKAMVNGVRR